MRPSYFLVRAARIGRRQHNQRPTVMAESAAGSFLRVDRQLQTHSRAGGYSTTRTVGGMDRCYNTVIGADLDRRRRNDGSNP
jgi:hypothetical protein